MTRHCEYEGCTQWAKGAYSDKATEAFLCADHADKLLADLESAEGPLYWRYSSARGYHVADPYDDRA